VKILVTGAAGHIGAVVMKKLINEGHKVIGLDSFSDYYSEDLKKSRIKFFDLEDKIVNCDVRNKVELQNLFANFCPNTVIHLAARPGVRAIWKDYETYNSTNIHGFENVLTMSKKFNVKKFIYASSSSVYTEDNTAPFNESEQRFIPNSYYALTKCMNEKMAFAASANDFEVIGLRFFTVYGPWSRPDMAVFQFAASASLGKIANLTANLSLRRDFTFVDDAAETVKAIANKKDKLSVPVINVGGGNPQSLANLARILEDMGLKIEFNKLQTSPLDLQFTHADTANLVINNLPVPKTTLIEGLAETLKWIRSIPPEKLITWMK
jgi:UDP-glucuronate 4-epimerase